MRPNSLNPSGVGPRRENFKKITGAFTAFIPDIKFQMKRTLLCGDKVLVVSRVTGTVANPVGAEEIPFFPGIPANALTGKSFETFAIDLHQIKNGRLRQAWHIEDWSNTGVSHMLRGDPPINMFDEVMLRTPVDIQYEAVYNSLGGVRPETIMAAVADDYQRRPNEINPFSQGPGAIGLGQALASFTDTFSSFKVTRKLTLSCSAAEPADNKQYVFVGGTLEATLSDTITQASIPMFPGIPASKVRGKSFRILINDLHQMENGKIKKTWHAEDWASALEQAVNGKTRPLLDNAIIEPGETLTEVPQTMKDFYHKILSDTGVLQYIYKALDYCLKNTFDN